MIFGFIFGVCSSHHFETLTGNITFVLGSIVFTIDAMYVRGSASAMDETTGKTRTVSGRGQTYELYKYNELIPDPDMGIEEGKVQQLDNLRSENFSSAAFNSRKLPASSTGD